MEKKVIVFHFIETLVDGEFNESKNHFRMTDEAKKFAEINNLIFKKCGGIRVVDFFSKPNVHVRESFWQSAEGYKQWMSDPEVKNYLLIRQRFNRSNGIREQLNGPYEARIHE